MVLTLPQAAADAQGQTVRVVVEEVQPGAADPPKLEQVWAGQLRWGLEDLGLGCCWYNNMYAQESVHDLDSTWILWLRLNIPCYLILKDCLYSPSSRSNCRFFFRAG